MKKLSFITVCALMVGLLGGCGSKLDASAYVKALLDNSYKNDSTEFVSMKLGTEAEAADLYEQGLDSEVDAMLAEAGGVVTETQAQEFRQVFADILAGAKYTVGEAEKQDDNSYVVTITYEQMQIFGPAMEGYVAEIEEMANDWAAAYAAGEEIPSDEEMVAVTIDLMREHFANSLQGVTYAEPQTTTIRVELVNNVYAPNQNDLLNFETVLFDFDAMTEVLNSLQ